MKIKIFKISLATIMLLVIVSTIAVNFFMSSDKPKVFFVYTQKEIIPDLAFKISAIPLAFASLLKYRKNAFLVTPATIQSVEDGFNKGVYMIVGTHGGKGFIYPDNGVVGPSEKVNMKMKHIYFGSCETGQLRDRWEQKFPNAKVTAFEGITYPFSGWKYLFLDSVSDIFSL